LKLICDQDFALIDRHLRQRLEAMLGPPADDPDQRSMNRQIIDYTLAGGKRIRPQLTAWTFRQFSAEPNTPLTPAVLDAGVVWELFHAFLLIHDDIIDGSDTRRDRPSLHRALARFGDTSAEHAARDYGVHLAIVAGDLLFSAAIRILHHVQTTDTCYRQLLQLFSRVACETGFGQAVDIRVSHSPLAQVSEASLLREYHWKTAAYTFEGPMLSGAILAGASAAAQRAITAYSLSLGQAYQMQNDLIDLARPVSPGSDLVQGKRTITLVRARAELDPAAQLAFDATLDRIRHGGPDALAVAQDLRQRLLSGHAIQRTRQGVNDLLASALAACQDPALPPGAGQSMKGLLASLRLAYFDLPAQA
jgi:geranylgeranyl diphosphate synthase type I